MGNSPRLVLFYLLLLAFRNTLFFFFFNCYINQGFKLAYTVSLFWEISFSGHKNESILPHFHTVVAITVVVWFSLLPFTSNMCCFLLYIIYHAAQSCIVLYDTLFHHSSCICIQTKSNPDHNIAQYNRCFCSINCYQHLFKRSACLKQSFVCVCLMCMWLDIMLPQIFKINQSWRFGGKRINMCRSVQQNTHATNQSLFSLWCLVLLFSHCLI